MERAASSVFCERSGVATSGTGAPSRTMTPMPARASGARVPARMPPALSSASITGTEAISMS